MDVFRKNRGLISVFLAIILVPIITVTSLFVDASRMMLAKSVVSSAGDLALNTMMTHYDSKLNDFYGLMASAQDIDDFKGKVKKYFENSMESKGVANNDIQNTLSQIDDIMEINTDYSDLLKIQLDGDDAFEVGTISNSGLDNPAILKTQIVNFMKYRAPIDAVSELLGKFQKVAEATENTGKDADLMKAKESAANEQQKAMKGLEALWTECVQYNEEVEKWEGASGARKKFEQLYQYIGSGCETQYKQLHEYVVCNLLYLPDSNDIETMIPTQKQYQIRDIKEKKYFKNTKKAASNDFEEAFKNIFDACVDFENSTAAQQVEKIVQEYDNSKQNEAVKYALYCKKITAPYKEYIEKANKVKESYAYLKQALEYPADGVDITKDKIKITYYAKNGTKTKEDTYVNVSNFVEKWVQDIAAFWEKTGTAYQKMQENEKYRVTKGKLREIIREVKNAGNMELQSIKERIQRYDEGLKEAEKRLDDAASKLSELQQKMESFEEVQDDREQKAENMKSDSDVAKADCDSMAGKEGDEIRELRENVSVKNIAAFRARVNLVKEKCRNLRETIDHMKYGTSSNNKKLKELGNVTDMASILEQSSLFSEEDIQNASLEELKDQADKTFAQVYSGAGGSDVDKAWINSNDESPDLGYKAGDSSTLLYEYMKNQFHKDENERKSGEDDYNAKKNKKNEVIDEESEDTEEAQVAETFKTTQKEIAGAEGLPSKTWKNGTVHGGAGGDIQNKQSKKNMDLAKASDGLRKTFGGSMLQKLKTAVASIRDDLYAMDYIFNMFTCDTTVKESLYDIAEAKEKENDNKMPTERLKVIEKEKNVIGIFNNTDITNKYNRTMTNKLLNNENNASMGNEIEYILYGGDIAKNKAKSWGSIFTIRFALNAIYGFSHLYSYEPKHVKDARIINDMAEMISAATEGIIPIPLVKIALILAVVVTETISDVADMKEGMPVALLKSKDDWKTSVSSVYPQENSNTDSANRNNSSDSTLKMRYSDYLKLFLLIEMIGDHEDVVYLRTADVIQTNAAMREEGFLMSKAKTWFHIRANTKTSPLMLNLTINSSMLQQVGISEDMLSGAWTKYQYSMSMGYY